MIRSCFKLSVVVVCWLMALLATQAYGQRQMENLGRGVVAVNQGGKVFVSWRLLGTDPDSIAFNLYRSDNGGNPDLIATSSSPFEILTFMIVTTLDETTSMPSVLGEFDGAVIVMPLIIAWVT